MGATSGHLAAGQECDGGGPQRHLGLAEADVPHHQPVHRAAGGEVGRDGRDGLGLVRGEGEGKARHEAPVGGGRRLQHRRQGLVALACEVHQGAGREGDLAPDALAPFRPAVVVETVEPDGVARRAVAPQEVQPLDRGQEVGLLGIVEPHRVARSRDLGAQRLEGAQHPDAVVDVDHGVADGEFAVARMPWDGRGVMVVMGGAMGPVAQEVGGAHDRDAGLVVDEAVFRRQGHLQQAARGSGRDLGPARRRGDGLAGRNVTLRRGLGQRRPVARGRARQHDAVPRGDAGPHEVLEAPRPTGLGVEMRDRLRGLVARQGLLAGGGSGVPFRGLEVEGFGRQGLHAGLGPGRAAAGGVAVVIGGLAQHLVDAGRGGRLDHQGRAGQQVEDRAQRRVGLRQAVFEPRDAPHGRVARRGHEGRDGTDRQRRDAAAGPLGGGVEGMDGGDPPGLDGEPERGRPGRKQVDHLAAQGEFPVVVDAVVVAVAEPLQRGPERAGLQGIAHREVERLGGGRRGREALHGGLERRHQHGAGLPFPGGSTRRGAAAPPWSGRGRRGTGRPGRRAGSPRRG